MVADGHLTPPPPLPGWNAGASFLTKKETLMPAIKLKLYANDDVITKLEDLGDGLGNFRGLRGVVRCDPENGDVRICGIPVVYDPNLDSPKETRMPDPISDFNYPRDLRPQTPPDAVQPTPETDSSARSQTPTKQTVTIWDEWDSFTPVQEAIDQVVAQSETVAIDDTVGGSREGPPDRRVYPPYTYAGDRRHNFGRRERDNVKPCGCTEHGPARQECVQCGSPLTAGGGVVQENCDSATRRKIRAEIIEEVTRFLTGD